MLQLRLLLVDPLDAEPLGRGRSLVKLLIGTGKRVVVGFLERGLDLLGRGPGRKRVNARSRRSLSLSLDVSSLLPAIPARPDEQNTHLPLPLPLPLAALGALALDFLATGEASKDEFSSSMGISKSLSSDIALSAKGRSHSRHALATT